MKHSEYISNYSDGYVAALGLDSSLEGAGLRKAIVDGYRVGSKLFKYDAELKEKAVIKEEECEYDNPYDKYDGKF